MQIYWAKIKKIIQEAPEVVTYLLECPEDFHWEEGAHTHLAMKGFNDGDTPNRELVRHMSIATVPDEVLIGVTTRIKAVCSTYKDTLKHLSVGDEVALFKTRSNIPLRRENTSVYLLSSGIGLATFRPLVLDYLKRTDDVKSLHSLNVESSQHYLYADVFKNDAARKFTAQFVDCRKDYYAAVKKLAYDPNGLFYIVGSDDFLNETIQCLREEGVKPTQIVLDKHPEQRKMFI